jgi:putative Ca2+/H+ antiporter (TMEM165/GDT1 family)
MEARFGRSDIKPTPMSWRIFFSVFSTVFLAEIGDKTQLATMLFAADREVNKWVVFAGAAAALVLAAGIGVLVGAQVERFVKPSTLKIIAGIGFIAIGIWTLVSR